MNDFTIRIRFRLPSGDRLGINESEISLGELNGHDVILKSADKDAAISEGHWLVLLCSGWESESAADDGKEVLIDSLCQAFAYCHLGADLGRRAPKGMVFNAGLKMLEQHTGQRALNDEHGAMIFLTNPYPKFARAGEIHAYSTKPGDRFQEAFRIAVAEGHCLSEQERTAFDLYTGAHAVEGNADARFVLLFAAIEALLDQSPRPEPVLRHIDQLLALTEQSNLDTTEKNSLLGSLRWMRNHSIRQSGKTLVQNYLGNKKYNKLPLHDTQVWAPAARAR